MSDTTQDLNQEAEVQPDLSSTQGSPSETPFGEQSIDEHIEKEQAEIEKFNEAEKEESAAEETEAETEESEDEEATEAEDEDEGEYKANPKYKVLDEEHEFDPKLKKILTKETEPIIRELYEKAHGLDAVKSSREVVTRERDELRGNYNGLVGEVGRILTYKKSGDLQSFFESVQLTDRDIANYILEKARIAQLPPEQQVVYNEREALRKRMNALEQNFEAAQSTGENAAVQARVVELDSVLSKPDTTPLAAAFDARNGKGAFKQAVMEHAAAKWHATKQDLTPKEAVSSFIKMVGLTVDKGQPKPGLKATKRVVARPQVKTIPNYGGGQASVTATNKPKSIEDLKKIRRDKFGS